MGIFEACSVFKSVAQGAVEADVGAPDQASEQRNRGSEQEPNRQ